MRLRNVTLAGMIILVLAFTVSAGAAQSGNLASENTKDADDIAPYDGPIPPASALYGLKIAFENLDESFTFNAAEKLQKKIAHASLRLAEAKGELKKGNSQAAKRAIEEFDEKSTEAESLISNSPDINSGLLHAQEMIKKHQQVLYNLTLSHPDNPGLARAYNNSLKLEQKFNRKISERKKMEEREEEYTKIKAEVIGNDTELKFSIRFKSDNTTNLAIAQEILDKFQLSTENINSLLTIENMDNGELKTELEAKARIGENFSIAEAEYTFPLLNTTSRDGIVSGIGLKLGDLTIENITDVLQIENMTNVVENKKEEKATVKQVKRDIKEDEQAEKATVKQIRREDKRKDR